MSLGLEVDLGGVTLPTPVLAAAGCVRSVKEARGLVDLRKVGGIVTTSVTLLPEQGPPSPRVAETPAGMLYAVGMQNPGLEAFVEGELAELLELGVPIFVSVAGGSLEEYVRVATVVDKVPGVAGIEINLACPDVERSGELFAQRGDHAAEVVGAVSRLTRRPLFAKLTSDAPDLVDVAGSCQHAGASGVTLVHGPEGMAIGVMSRRPSLGGIVGRLAGPAVRPMAVRAVYEVARALPDLPIMGVGGVSEPQHAVEMMLAGAWAVQVGTGMLVNPSAPIDVARGVLRYLRAAKLDDVTQLRGQGHPTAS